MSKLNLFKADCLSRKIILDCEQSRYNYFVKEKENNRQQELYTWAIAASNFALGAININTDFFINNGVNYKPAFVLASGFGLACAVAKSVEGKKKDKLLTKKINRVKKDLDKAQSTYDELQIIEI